MISLRTVHSLLLLHLTINVFILKADGFKLSEEQNAKLQETCGANMKEVRRYSRKVLNGTTARSGESPWTVAVYLTDHLDKTVYTTGTLVSRWHILTYDGLFVTKTADGLKMRHNMEAIDQKCEGTDWILPKTLVRRVSVYLNMLRTDRFSGREELQLRSVTVLNGCEQPIRTNRVAVLELVAPIEAEQKARPACISADARSQPSSYTFYGFGDNRGDVVDARLRHTNVSVAECPSTDSNSADDVFCVTARHPLCNGDFGGAGVRKLNDAIQAFGIYVEGPYECSKADADTVFKFANLTTLAEPICNVTGICSTDLKRATVEDDEIEIVDESESDSRTQSESGTGPGSCSDCAITTSKKIVTELAELKEELRTIRKILKEMKRTSKCKKRRTAY